jgi:DNA-binding transcriptional LysR family regulator
MRARSIREAAGQLGVSQPAVSMSLRRLEDIIGFRLFERDGAGLRRTPDADALAPALAGVFASMAAFSDSGQAIREGRAGQVIVGAVLTLANVVLPPAWQAACVRHPGLRVSVRILPTQQIVEGVARGAIELGLVHDILENPQVKVENLGAAGMACIVPKGHPLAGRRVIDAKDLRNAAYVSYAEQSPMGVRIAQAFRSVGETFSPAVEVVASTAVCAFVLGNRVPGLVEDYVLSHEWWPDLQRVPFVPPIPLRPRLITTLRRPLPAAARTLAAECRTVVMRTLQGQVASTALARRARRR